MIKGIKEHIGLFILLLIILLIILIIYGFYHYFYDINSVPKGQYVSSLTSPDGKYTIKSYLNSSATVDFSIVVELINEQNNKSRNIYFQYHKNKAEMEWIDNTTIKINGIELNILKDTYDYRRK